MNGICNPDRSAFIRRLVEEIGYSAHAAERTFDDVARLDDETKAALRHWWTTGELDTTAVHGYTVAALVNELGFKPPGAHIMIGWLRGAFPEQSTDEALRILRRRSAGRRGGP